jgi:hypothetical protein
MYFSIRDDDTSFFTSPEELEHAYGEVTGWGPVSLAVIPYCRAGFSKGVPEKFRGRWSVHPLHENRALVDYLRRAVSQGRFEIMLHGYHHDEPSGRGEFLRGPDLVKKVVDGRQYLQDLLDAQIRVFVAPRNTMGRDGLRAVVRAGLHFGGTIGIRAGWPLLSTKTWNNWIMLRRWRKKSPLALPWILDLGDHREIPGNAVTPSALLRNNKTAFDTALAVDGTFCAATHYWELAVQSINAGDPPVGVHLRYLVDLARSNPHVRWRSVADAVIDGAVLQ